MRGFKTFALVATASVLLAGSLQAQWTGKFNWVGTYANTRADYRNLVGGRTWQTYTSPYKASFSNVVATPLATVESDWYLPPSGTQVDIFCVDLLNTAGSGYNANFTNLDNAKAIESGLYTRNSSQIKYLKAAYLAQMIGHRTSYGVDEVKDITGAIWQIMTGASEGVRTMGWRLPGSTADFDNTGVAFWVKEAGDHYDSVNAADWVVVTDQGSIGHEVGGYQEHLTQVTPEPATMLLLGTGLVVMLMAAGALRRPVA